MSHVEFVDYWQTNHTPVARDIEGIVQCNQALPSDPENAEFDGAAELYSSSAITQSAMGIALQEWVERYSQTQG